MNILLTGCAGFIGHRTAIELLNAGHSVFGIDSMNSASYPSAIKWQRLLSLTKNTEIGGKFTYLIGDITSSLAIDQIDDQTIRGKNQFDAIIHLAAMAGVRASTAHPQTFVDTNIKGTVNILEFARRAKINKIVVASSSSVYGKTGEYIIKTNKELDDIIYPLSPYGATKVAVEAMCNAYSQLYDMDIPKMRFFTVYGENGRPDMSMHIFISKILAEKEITIFGDGTQERDFTYVGDIADALRKSVSVNTHSQAINLGNSNPIKIIQLVSLIEKYTRKTAKIRYAPKDPADVPQTFAEITIAKKLLGWSPKVQIDEGVQRTVTWHKENNVLG